MKNIFQRYAAISFCALILFVLCAKANAQGDSIISFFVSKGDQPNESQATSFTCMYIPTFISKSLVQTPQGQDRPKTLVYKITASHSCWCDHPHTHPVDAIPIEGNTQWLSAVKNVAKGLVQTAITEAHKSHGGHPVDDAPVVTSVKVEIGTGTGPPKYAEFEFVPAPEWSSYIVKCTVIGSDEGQVDDVIEILEQEAGGPDE